MENIYILFYFLITRFMGPIVLQLEVVTVHSILLVENILNLECFMFVH